jgi:hypothetical protein
MHFKENATTHDSVLPCSQVELHRLQSQLLQLQRNGMDSPVVDPHLPTLPTTPDLTPVLSHPGLASGHADLRPKHTLRASGMSMQPPMRTRVALHATASGLLASMHHQHRHRLTTSHDPSSRITSPSSMAVECSTSASCADTGPTSPIPFPSAPLSSTRPPQHAQSCLQWLEGHRCARPIREQRTLNQSRAYTTLGSHRACLQSAMPGLQSDGTAAVALSHEATLRPQGEASSCRLDSVWPAAASTRSKSADSFLCPWPEQAGGRHRPLPQQEAGESMMRMVGEPVMQRAFAAACSQNELLRGTLAAMRAEMEHLQRTAADSERTARQQESSTSPRGPEDTAEPTDPKPGVAPTGGHDAQEVAELQRVVVQQRAERMPLMAAAAEAREQAATAVTAVSMSEGGEVFPVTECSVAPPAPCSTATAAEALGAGGSETLQAMGALSTAADHAAVAALSKALAESDDRVGELQEENERLMELSSQQRAEFEDLTACLPPTFVRAALGQCGWLMDGAAWKVDVAGCSTPLLMAAAKVQESEYASGGARLQQAMQNTDPNAGSVWVGRDEAIMARGLLDGGGAVAAASSSDGSEPVPQHGCRDGSSSALQPQTTASTPCAPDVPPLHPTAHSAAPALATATGSGMNGGRAHSLPRSNSQRSTVPQRRRLLALSRRRGTRAAEDAEMVEPHAHMALRARNWNVRDDASDASADDGAPAE